MSYVSCDKDFFTCTCAAKGKAASIQKIVDLRGGCGSVAMALASGITPANAAEYAPHVDCFMVATGISPPGEYGLDTPYTSFSSLSPPPSSSLFSPQVISIILTHCS